MKHKVVFLQTAVDDLKEIRRYVSRHFSPAVWQDAYGKIKNAILGLQQTPYRGHTPEELPATHFLEIIAVKNRVVYEVLGDKVYIHLICDCRQDFQTKLARRPIRALFPPK